MTQSALDNDATGGVFGTAAARRRTDSLGTMVVRELVTIVVTRRIGPGELLPPEQQLVDHFGVSRTVIRESVKRLEEKGLLRAVQGRGTVVQEPTAWNVLDPIVLSVMIEHDSSIGVLDDFAAVRSVMEGMMSASMASRATDEDIADLRAALDHMHECRDDAPTFGTADADFHRLVMSRSGNYLAENITRSLFTGALASERFARNQTPIAFGHTLAEHTKVFEAIAARDPQAAEAAMREHITVSWIRRRPRDVEA